MEMNGETIVCEYHDRAGSTPQNSCVPHDDEVTHCKVVYQNCRENIDNDANDQISLYDISKLSDDAAAKLNLLGCQNCAEQVPDGQSVQRCSTLLNGCDHNHQGKNGYVQNHKNDLLAHLHLRKDIEDEIAAPNQCKKCQALPADDYSQELLSTNTSSISPVSQTSNSTSITNTDFEEHLFCNSASSSPIDSEIVPTLGTVRTQQGQYEVETTKPSHCEQIADRTCLLNAENCLCNESISKTSRIESDSENVVYIRYESELQMPDIMRLIQKDLSEPYSIYTYRYFIHNWPELCFLAKMNDKCVGAIVCKLDHHNKVKRGYIAMLAVDENYRKKKIGSKLVLKAIQAMIAGEAGEIVLETEITNKPALKLYENLGFVRDKRLFRYYLNGVDALRLKLWIQ